MNKYGQKEDEIEELIKYGGCGKDGNQILSESIATEAYNNY